MSDLESSTLREIVEGMLRVHAANMTQVRLDPDGDSPKCKPGIGTGICERCGLPIRHPKTGQLSAGPCPAVPVNQRWRTEYPARAEMETSPAPLGARLTAEGRSAISRAKVGASHETRGLIEIIERLAGEVVPAADEAGEVEP